MRYLLIVCILAFTLDSGCHKSATSPLAGEPAISAYPVVNGMTWQYNYYSAPYDIRMKDTSAPPPLDTVYGVSTVKVIGDTVLRPGGLPGADSVRVSAMVESYRQLVPVPSDLSISNGYQYYSVDQNGMYLHGYRSAGMLSLPKGSPKTFAVRAAGRTFSSMRDLVRTLLGNPFTLADDPISREIPPKLTLRFPLAVGVSWTFRAAGQPFRIDKQVIGEEEYTVSGTSYRCATVRWLYDMDNSGTWSTSISIVDLVSSSGLLKRTIDLKDILVTTSTNPDSGGLLNVREEYSATSVPSI